MRSTMEKLLDYPLLEVLLPFLTQGADLAVSNDHWQDPKKSHVISPSDCWIPQHPTLCLCSRRTDTALFGETM